jgi:hypothetical protein
MAISKSRLKNLENYFGSQVHIRLLRKLIFMRGAESLEYILTGKIDGRELTDSEKEFLGLITSDK